MFEPAPSPSARWPSDTGGLGRKIKIPPVAPSARSALIYPSNSPCPPRAQRCHCSYVRVEFFRRLRVRSILSSESSTKASPSPPLGFCCSSQSVLLNLVLAVVLEGASDQMKEKHAAQKFRDNTLRLFHNQYKRLAIRRWSTKLRAEDMLKRGALHKYCR